MAFAQKSARTLAKPAEKPKTKAPRAHEWQVGLRELPREAGLMWEDFGFTKSSATRYAEKAARGDKEAIARLEPLKQFFFTLMGLDKEMRIVRHEEGDLAAKPVMVGTGEFVTINGKRVEVEEPLREERSRWGMRAGPDMVTHQTARKPRPSQVYLKVSEHFYSLLPLLEFVKVGVPLKFHGRQHPNPEGFREAHNALTGGTKLDGSVFNKNDKKALEAEFDRVKAATQSPVRADTLELLKEHFLKGCKSDWTGED